MQRGNLRFQPGFFFRQCIGLGTDLVPFRLQGFQIGLQRFFFLGQAVGGSLGLGKGFLFGGKIGVQGGNLRLKLFLFLLRIGLPGT